MKRYISNFKQFINESMDNNNVNLLKYLEQKFNIELDVTLDSKKEGVDPDDKAGDYLQCEVYPNPVEHLNNGLPVTILIYPNTEKVQFFYDATPYPTLISQRDQGRDMGMSLNPQPVSIKEVTKKDYKRFINSIIKEYNVTDDNWVQEGIDQKGRRCWYVLTGNHKQVGPPYYSKEEAERNIY